MKDLNLENFSEDNDLGIKILTELSCTSTTLENLNLSSNDSWWNNELCFTLLLSVLQKQKLLKTLKLKGSLFSEEQTEILLKTIAENEILSSLGYIYLYNAANFSSNMSVHYLAEILAKASSIEYFKIRDQ